MFCPKCGNANQEPETFCRQCGNFLPDFDKIRKKEIPPEEHLKANSILTAMTGVVSAILAVLLYVNYLGRDDTPFLIYLTAGFLTAMFFWQAQTYWRTILLKKQLPKKRRGEPARIEAPDTNPLMEAERARGVLRESEAEATAPSSVVENTTKRLKESPSSRK